jgi:hypothetical protein
MTSPSKLKYAAGLLLAALVLFATDNASAQSLTSKSASALRQLVAQNRAANKVSQNAIAVLVFPEIVKAGFIFGGQGGEGVLFVRGKRTGRYRTFAASYGLQAGVQKYGYALFFMNQRAVDWVNETVADDRVPARVVIVDHMARVDTQTLHAESMPSLSIERADGRLGIRDPGDRRPCNWRVRESKPGYADARMSLN